MAAVAKLHAARQPPIPLNPVTEYHRYPTTRVTTQFDVINANNTTTRTVTRKQDLPFAPNTSDTEHLICALDDFKEACIKPERLNIQDESMHKKVFDIIGGDLRIIWKDLLILATNKLTAAFVTNTRTFLSKFLPSKSFLIQQEYLISATKPFSVNCFVPARCLRLINNLSIYLPGSNGKHLFEDDTSFKNAFYRIMLPDWQFKFNSTGMQLDDANYHDDQLVAFMEQQRILQDTTQASSRRTNRPARSSHPSTGYNSYSSYNNHRYQPYNTQHRLPQVIQSSQAPSYNNSNRPRNNNSFSNRSFRPSNHNLGRCRGGGGRRRSLF